MAASSRDGFVVAELLRDTFLLFVYGTLRSGGRSSAMLQNAQLIGDATVGGVLYDIDGEYPALVLYGNTPVSGEVWRCANEMLPRLDAFERVDDGVFRRVGLEVDTSAGVVACWTYVAGPALTRKLVPAQRVEKWPTAR